MQFPRLLFLLTAALLGATAAAQCATVWQPGFGPAGTDYEVHATGTFDPDGGGPLPARLVVGGRFTIAGTTPAVSIASRDPLTSQWEPLGAGFNGPVLALATLANGNLVAAGQFTGSGGQALLSIAQWNGTVWSPLGTGTFGNVLALTVLPNGDLIAGGIFSDIGNNLARWNGSSWSGIGAGVNGTVLALQTLTGSSFVAGGLFPGGVQRWTGFTWAAVGGGTNGPVAALAQMPSGDLVAGGDFTAAGAAAALRVARWNGTGWSALGTGCNDEVKTLLALGNGDLLAGGAFTSAGGAVASCVARWDGSAWSAADTTVPTGPPTFVPGGVWVNALGTLPGGGVVAGGSFSAVGGVGANNVALRGEVGWSATNPGTNAPIAVLTPLANGEVVAGGAFRVIDGVAANGIARWDGTTWLPYGLGVDDTVLAIAPLPNGDLVVGGRFTSAGGAPADNIALWTSGGWAPLGAGIAGDVVTLAARPNGEIVAGGDFLTPAAGVARWNGASWSAIGGGIAGTGFPGRVAAVVTMPNGDLVIAGDFFAAGGVAANNIARWNGSAWSPLGNGLLPFARTMMTLPNGELLVGGTLLIQGPTQVVTGIARWDGSVWSAFTPATSTATLLHAVAAIGRLPGGNLVAGGKPASSLAGNWLARQNGTTWSYAAPATNNSLLLADEGLALAPSRDGDLLVGGLFTRVGLVISAGLARLTTTCPAAVTSVAAGCPSSGGNNQLAAVALPWTGAMCRLRSTGVPSPALVLAVLGFAPVALPLSAVFPQAGSGCVLAAAPDFVDVGSSVAGSFDYAFALPNAPALAGLVIYHQHVPFELDAQLQLLAVTATNTLQLTIGTF